MHKDISQSKLKHKHNKSKIQQLPVEIVWFGLIHYSAFLAAKAM